MYDCIPQLTFRGSTVSYTKMMGGISLYSCSEKGR